MSTGNDGGGAPNPNPNAGGASGGGTPPASNAGDDRVAKADLDRALNDMHRFKEAAKAKDTELSSLRSTVEDLQTKLASGSKDFETLWTGEKAKREAAERERDTFKSNVLHSERHRAAYPALKKAGLRDDAENLLEHMDLKEIEIEVTSNGRFIPNNVDKFVEKVAAAYPYAFQKGTPPTVNGGTGSGTPGAPQQWTPDSLYALEVQCKRKGDMNPYRAAVAEYQKSKQKQA